MTQLRPLPFMSTGKQQGAVLFFALIALVILMLASAALTRTIDTATVISGNFAFKQAATASGDNGVEAAVKWLAKTSNENMDKDPFSAASNHPFNTMDAANGYFPTMYSIADLKADATWSNAASASAGTDASGNNIRYVIQRMCNNLGPLSDQNCLFSDAETDNGSKRVKSASEAGARPGGKIPLNRVTVKVIGPRNTVSYIQAFVY